MALTFDAGAWERLSRLHEEALGLSGAAREACLAAADAGLAAEVREMLAGPELDLERQLERDGGADLAGTRIGDYHLLRLLGRGGMGEVYLGERAGQGFEQLVAVKVLRAGLFGSEARERFEQERRIQARLAHPAVVPLLDGGVADDGRPFLVLQYVDGVEITHHAARRALSLEARLRLFAEVCRGVHHAHSRLVVHRDLKPSNILVGDDGAVRLLDFGIAKLLQDDGEAGITQGALAPMTPERAAPEQVRGEPTSTATDVWGLGVLLFELLAGRLPFETAGRTPAELERLLSLGEPHLASALPVGEALAVLARERGTTPRGLRRFLAGDVQSVVGQALRVQPERRYGSAAELAEDVLRVLDGRPVLARADALGYRLRRWAGRHPGGVVAAATALAALLAFAGASWVHSSRLARARDRAEGAARRADAVVELLVGLVGGTDPASGAPYDRVAVSDLLSRGEQQIDALRDQPEVQARMYVTLARIRRERAELTAAVPLLDRAAAAMPGAAPDEPGRLEITLERARVLFRLDRSAEAVADLRAVLPLLEEANEPGPLAEALLQLGTLVGGEAGVPLLERSLALRRALLPADPLAVADGLNALANVTWRLGRTAEARAQWSEALELMKPVLGDDHPHTVIVLGNLALVAETLEQQIALQRRVLAAQSKLLGPGSGPAGNAWNNLGVALALHRDYAEAEAALRRSLEIRAATLGPDHRETFNTRRNVARCLELQGRFSESLEEFEAVARGLARTGAPPGPVVGHDVQRAQVLLRLGRPEQARPLLERSLAALGTTPGSEAERSNALLILGRLALAQGDPGTAAERAREALALRRAAAPDSPRVAEARADLGRALLAAGRRQEAREHLGFALPRISSWGMAHPDDVAAVRAALAAAGS